MGGNDAVGEGVDHYFIIHIGYRREQDVYSFSANKRRTYPQHMRPPQDNMLRTANGTHNNAPHREKHGRGSDHPDPAEDIWE